MNEFLNDEEALQYLYSKSHHAEQVRRCQCLTTVKVYPGLDFVVYNYDFDGEFNLLSIQRVMDIFTDHRGVTVRFVDKKNFNSCYISHVPEALAGYDVFAHVPQRPVIERTLRREEKTGKVMESVSTAIVLMHHERSKYSLNQDYAMPFGMAKRIKLADGRLIEKCEEKGYHIYEARSSTH